MWLGIKFETWGFIFGAAALVLAVPLAVVGNLLTPRLQDWWADRSTRSAQARATALKRELEDYEQHYGLVDPPLLVILINLGRALWLACVTICAFFCALTLPLLLAVDHPSPEPHHTGFVLFTAAVCGLILLFAYLFGLWSSSQIMRYVRRHSADYRDYLTEAIGKLESHLKR